MPIVGAGRKRRGVSRRRAIPRKKAITRLVKTEIKKHQEKKYLLTEVAGAAISNSGTITGVSEIVPGDDFNDRDGIEVIPTSLELNVVSVLGDSTNFVRYILFRWMPNSANLAPTVAQLLEDTTFPYISPYNMVNRKQFQVLMDRVVTLDAASQNVHVFRKKMKLANKKIIYDSGAVSTGAGKLYLLQISDSGAATHPASTWYGKLNFTD